MKIEDPELVKRIVEGALMAADKPLSKRDLKDLFDAMELPDDALFEQALKQLEAECEARGYELQRVASGYRFQVKQELGPWISKLWKERAPRYSRALLETLSLVAYRQPITRGEIEEIRGVAVSTQIIKTLLEREWVKVVGHRDVPGRPAIYATTRQFLDYFNLKSLDQLPPLAEIRELGTISRELNIDLPLDAIEPANDDGVGGSQPETAEVSEATAKTAQTAETEAEEELAAFESWQDDSDTQRVTSSNLEGDTATDENSGYVSEAYADELEAQMSSATNEPPLKF
ncbi:MAG: SMC-Scp complex subunit ScpB [Pseudomonadales bacterium]|nr:SMC-Scp complex subunit ScpB [Pseudomonadales bacterium]